MWLERILGVEDKEQQASNWGAPALSEEQLLYAAKDVELLCELDGELHRQVTQAGLGAAYSLECRALPAMAQMARTGLPWDRKNSKRYATITRPTSAIWGVSSCCN